MSKRLIALALAMAFGLALGANIASAEAGQPAAVAASAAAAQKSEAAGTTEAEAPEPDAEGTLSFDNLRGRMLEHYYPLLALEEGIRAVEDLDYARMETDLRDALNEMADTQWSAMSMSSALPANALTPTAIAGMMATISDASTRAALEAALTASSAALEASRGALSAVGNMVSSSIQPTYDETKKLFDAVRDGELKKDNDAVLRELQNRRNQAIIGAESIYITCAGLNAQNAALTRSLAALARSEEELRLRNRLGQVSDFTLQSVENGRIQAESGKETLQMNIGNLLLRLKVMTGIDMDAELSLAALPTVTAEQLAALSPEQDLAAAQEASYELYDAKKTYDDAKEEYDDALKKYGSYSKKNEWMQAKHTWQAAQYTYENAKQSYELKFRTLYTQVKDAAQIIESKRAALAAQEKSYQVSALKYQQGTIAANELANAGDELAKVKDELASAERDLFTQYRSYQWAVEYGILNS